MSDPYRTQLSNPLSSGPWSPTMSAQLNISTDQGRSNFNTTRTTVSAQLQFTTQHDAQQCYASPLTPYTALPTPAQPAHYVQVQPAPYAQQPAPYAQQPPPYTPQAAPYPPAANYYAPPEPPSSPQRQQPCTPEYDPASKRAPVLDVPLKESPAGVAQPAAAVCPATGVQPVVGIPIDPVTWRQNHGVTVIDTEQMDMTVDFIVQHEEDRCCLYDAGKRARLYCNGVSRWRFCTKQLAGANPDLRYWYPRLWCSKIDNFLDKHRNANRWVWEKIFAAPIEDEYGRISCWLVIKKIVLIILFLLFMSVFGIFITVLQSIAFVAYFAALVCHIRNRCAYSDPGNCIYNEKLLQLVNKEFNNRAINQWVGFSLEHRRLVISGSFTLSVEETQRLCTFNAQCCSTVSGMMATVDDETVAVLVVGDRFMSLYKWAIVKSMIFMVVVYAWTIFILVMAMKHFGH